MSKLTQISLDFGQEPQAPPPAEPAAVPTVNDVDGVAPVRSYMAAGGVGVRIKAYKQVPTPQTGDLFGGMPVEETPAVAADPAIAETIEAVTPEAAEPEPVAMEAVAAVPAVPQPAAAEPLAAVVVSEEPEAILEEPEMMLDEPAVTLQEPEPVIEREPTPAPVAETVVAAPVAKAPTAKSTTAAKSSTATKRAAAAKQGPSKRGRKSLKQVSAEADLIEIPEDEVLFSKQYYTMGEVSEMFRVNQSLLRFWETEFDILQPRKNKKGDRYFRPIDIKNLHLIYHLLRQKKYTIEGAKDFLKKNKKAEERFEVIQRLQQIKAFLQEMKGQL